MGLLKQLFCSFSSILHGVDSEACSDIVHSIPKFSWAWTSTSLVPQHALIFHVGQSVQNGLSLLCLSILRCANFSSSHFLMISFLIWSGLVQMLYQKE
jgi:hypothetical protein